MTSKLNFRTFSDRHWRPFPLLGGNVASSVPGWWITLVRHCSASSAPSAQMKCGAEDEEEERYRWQGERNRCGSNSNKRGGIREERALLMWGASADESETSPGDPFVYLLTSKLLIFFFSSHMRILYISGHPSFTCPRFLPNTHLLSSLHTLSLSLRLSPSFCRSKLK